MNWGFGPGGAPWPHSQQHTNAVSLLAWRQPRWLSAAQAVDKYSSVIRARSILILAAREVSVTRRSLASRPVSSRREPHESSPLEGQILPFQGSFQVPGAGAGMGPLRCPS